MGVCDVIFKISQIKLNLELINSPYDNDMVKEFIKIDLKEKNWKFSSKKPSATKNSPPSNVLRMEFYCNFLNAYSIIGIVKPKTSRNKI